MYSLGSETAIPDLLVFRDFPFWMECKAKSRIVTKWAGGPDCTGYDLRSHRHYRKVQSLTRIPVFVLFDNNGAWVGNWLDILSKNQHSKILRTTRGAKEIVLFPLMGRLSVSANWEKDLKKWFRLIGITEVEP
jgi:hypothetical protein